MKKLFNSKSSFSQKAFTLIELLIVIAVLGVLAAAVVAAINPVQKINKAKDSTVKSDMGQLVNALQAYFTGQPIPQYPVNLDGLVTGNELKSVPKQQAGNVACPAANAGSVVVANGTPGSVGYYYCYYTVTVSGTVTSIAVMGSLYETASTFHCFDSKNGAYKTSTLAPTIASGELNC